MSDGSPIATQAAQVIDEAIESVDWCRKHLEERSVSERLRTLQITLAGLALAIEYEMEGERDRAAQALEHARWRFDLLRQSRLTTEWTDV
jgi:hypothetical protein